MSRRLVAWLAVAPLALAGVLAGHGVAYAQTGVEADPLHDYLAHGPQLAVVGALAGLVLLAFQQRTQVAASPWSYAFLGIVTFAAQEHAERIAHGDALPFLLANPTFLLGLALQLPIAFLCARLARLVLGTARGRGQRLRLLGTYPAVLVAGAESAVVPQFCGAPRGRAPPAHL